MDISGSAVRISEFLSVDTCCGITNTGSVLACTTQDINASCSMETFVLFSEPTYASKNQCGRNLCQ